MFPPYLSIYIHAAVDIKKAVRLGDSATYTAGLRVCESEENVKL